MCLALPLLVAVKFRSPEDSSCHIIASCNPLFSNLNPVLPPFVELILANLVPVLEYLGPCASVHKELPPEPPAPHDTLPAPSVVNTCPLVPSTLGNV